MRTTEKLEALGIDLRGKITGQIITLCPQCSESRKKKKEKCLAVNIDKGVYNCHHCEWQGKVFDPKEQEKHYELPVVNNTGLNDRALAWLNDVRGLSKSTVMRFKLSSEGKDIVFPYILDGQIVHTKYRDASKRFRASKNTKMILFGMHLEHSHDRLIITEGEFDAMSFYEAGHSAVSVPNGANGFTWIENCADWIDQFKEIVIAFDQDIKGLEGRNELARRLGKHRCKIFRYPEGIKDANDLLMGAKKDLNWKELFNAYFEYIDDFPLDGIITIESLREKAFDLHKAGFPKGEATGFSKLDELITFAPGQLTIVTGIPNHGKSEFVDQLMINMKNLNWLLFSPENMPYETHLMKLVEKTMGKNYFSMTEAELARGLDHLESHFSFCDLDSVKSIEDIIDKTREVVLRKGIKGVLVDPYSRVEHRYMSKMNETQYVREILDKLSLLARQTGVHIILVAHPTKMKKDANGEYEVPNLYDIAGSAHFFNTADNGLCVYRRPHGDFDMTEVHIQKIRFKWVGKIGMAEFRWTPGAGTYKPEDPFS